LIIDFIVAVVKNPANVSHNAMKGWAGLVAMLVDRMGGPRCHAQKGKMKPEIKKKAK
jgi:hypothetical protein